jgi:hypothetical protein
MPGRDTSDALFDTPVADLALRRTRKQKILLFVSRSDDRRPTTSRARLRETPTR